MKKFVKTICVKLIGDNEYAIIGMSGLAFNDCKGYDFFDSHFSEGGLDWLLIKFQTTGYPFAIYRKLSDGTFYLLGNKRGLVEIAIGSDIYFFELGKTVIKDRQELISESYMIRKVKQMKVKPVDNDFFEVVSVSGDIYVKKYGTVDCIFDGTFETEFDVYKRIFIKFEVLDYPFSMWTIEQKSSDRYQFAHNNGIVSIQQDGDTFEFDISCVNVYEENKEPVKKAKATLKLEVGKTYIDNNQSQILIIAENQELFPNYPFIGVRLNPDGSAFYKTMHVFNDTGYSSNAPNLTKEVVKPEPLTLVVFQNNDKAQGIFKCYSEDEVKDKVDYCKRYKFPFVEVVKVF